MDKFLKGVGATVLIAVVIAGTAALGAYPIKWTVNYLINPRWLIEAFGTPQIGFWQAFSLLYLAAALIKGTPVVASK